MVFVLYHPYSIVCGPIISARFHTPPLECLVQAAGVGSYEPAMPLVMPSYELRRVLRPDESYGSVTLVRLPQTLRTPKEWWNYRGEQVRFCECVKGVCFLSQKSASLLKAACKLLTFKGLGWCAFARKIRWTQIQTKLVVILKQIKVSEPLN